MLQPKRVPRKGRYVSCAPEKQGFPLMQCCYHAAPELAHVEKARALRQLAQKSHDNSTASMAC